MVTRVGDRGAGGRDGGFDVSWPPGDGYGAAGASSALASLRQAGAELASALGARPSLLAGIVAVPLAALLGTWLAGRFPRRPAAPGLAELPTAMRSGGAFTRAGRKLGEASRSRSAERATDRVQAGLSLIPLGAQLLSNPIVRYYVRRALARQLAETFRR